MMILQVRNRLGAEGCGGCADAASERWAETCIPGSPRSVQAWSSCVSVRPLCHHLPWGLPSFPRASFSPSAKGTAWPGIGDFYFTV